MNIEQYLTDVRVRLAKVGPLAERPLAEMRDHLRESVRELVAGGKPLEEAELEAVRRFGDAERIASELAAALRTEIDPVERVLKVLGFSNLFVAVWGLAAVVMLEPRAELLGVCILSCVATLATVIAATRRVVAPRDLLVTGVVLAAVGVAGIVWAVFAPRPGFDPEIGLALLMTVYGVQGVLALAAGVRRERFEIAAQA